MTAKQKIKKMQSITEMARYFTRIMKILSSAGRIYLVNIMFLAVIFGVIPSISVLVMQEIVNALQTGHQTLHYILILVLVYNSIK